MVALRRVFYVVGILACLGLIATFLWNKFLDSPLNIPTQNSIYVPPGSSIFSVAKTLRNKNVIASPHLFVLVAELRGDAKRLKAGEYWLIPGMTPDQLLKNIVNGKVIMRHYTIVEGWTLKQILATINANPFLGHTSGTHSTDELAKALHTSPTELEGYLYPDTYLFAAGVHDIVILQKAFKHMKHTLNKLWPTRSQGLPYHNMSDALIVASLIEKETARPEERARIAGVIIRRLQVNMRLQIDASVIYGLGDLYNGRLTKEDLKKDTLYNTYIHFGLPPTPIAVPSLPSIIAALHPAIGSELYYVARGDGSHQFSNSLQEHDKAIRSYHVQHLEQLQPTGFEMSAKNYSGTASENLHPLGYPLSFGVNPIDYLDISRSEQTTKPKVAAFVPTVIKKSPSKLTTKQITKKSVATSKKFHKDSTKSSNQHHGKSRKKRPIHHS